MLGTQHCGDTIKYYKQGINANDKQYTTETCINLVIHNYTHVLLMHIIYHGIL